MSRRRRKRSHQQQITPAATISTADHILNRLIQAGVCGDGVGIKETTINIPLAIPDATAVNARKKATQNEAIKNQKYYLDLAAKSGKLWFHSPKVPYQYSEFILLTVEMAELLAERIAPTRKWQPKQSELYSRDVKTERWLQTDEAIAIDENGDLANGNHRVRAVIMAGKPCVFYFTFNVPPESRFVYDSGKKRNVNEKLGMLMNKDNVKLKSLHKTAAICRAMMRGIQPDANRYTESEIAEFALKYEDVISWAIKAVPATRSDVQACLAKAALLHGKARLEPFCERLRTVVFQSTTDPAARLYKFLGACRKEGGITGIVIYKKTLSSIYNFLDDKDTQALYERNRDVFEWEQGWEIPSNANNN